MGDDIKEVLNSHEGIFVASPLILGCKPIDLQLQVSCEVRSLADSLQNQSIFPITTCEHLADWMFCRDGLTG